jgi:fatty acid desaturase
MSTQDGLISASPLAETSEHGVAWQVKLSAILSVPELAELNERSDAKGWLQLAIHLSIMGVSGAIWGLSWSNLNWNTWAIAIPALVIYGFSLASMFAVVHECTHRTAFASQGMNDGVALVAR